MNEQEFVGLLESLLLPDTEKVKSATAALKKNYYTSPNSLTALIHILSSHPSHQLRQLAAVEARNLVPKHWTNISGDEKAQLRNQLLQSTLKEENKLVRHSSSRVVSAIAKIDFVDDAWSDLPRTLQEVAISENPLHREVGVYIIFTLVDTLGDFFVEHLGDLFTLFTKTIQDPQSSEVRLNTMMTLGRVAMLIDGDEDAHSREAFQNCVPHMVAVLKGAIDANDEAHVNQAFEVFQTLLGCDASLLQTHFRDLILFMMEIATTTSLPADYRSQSLSFLMQCARYRKLKIQALRLGEELVLKSLPIVTELGDISEEDEDVTPARSALGLLDTLASSLPPSQVLVPLLKAIGPYVTNPNPDYRRAGILALAMCVEGAPDFITTQLPEIIPMVLRLLEDPDVRVRAAALNGVARLADDLAEDVAKEHAKLVPAMIRNFDLAVQALPSSQGIEHDRYLSIIHGSCNAVESLIEGLDNKEEAVAYASQLVPRFSQFLSPEADLKSRNAAAGAVGSIAAASGEAFMPYFEQTMQILGQYLEVKESQDELDLRGNVCDSMGKIAAAVGAAPFQKYVQPLMHASEEALHLDHPRLRETSYILWSVMAKVYEEEFSPYLPGVVKAIQDCLEQDEKETALELAGGTEVEIGGKKFRVVEPDSDDDDEYIETASDDDLDYNPATAVAMEKEIAIEVIGDIISSTRDKFLPYLEKTVETVLSLVEHQYEGVRKSAISTVCRAYACLWGMAEGQGMEKWQPGFPLKVQPAPEIKKLGSALIAATLAVWHEEMDRGTVTDINRDLAATLKLCGPAILVDENGGENLIEVLVELLLQIITKHHPCQQDLGDDGEDAAPEESSEYDWLVIDTAIDCITCLSAALGPDFGQIWKNFEKPLIKYASSQESIERTAAIGGIAECISNMEGGCTPFTTSLMRVLTRRIGDEDMDTKINAIYGIGLLCEKSDDTAEITKNYPSILTQLEPFLTSDTPNKRLLDNSAGCVSRMIKKHPQNVPLQEVLPRLVELLPAKEDFAENNPAFQCIVSLYHHQEPTIQTLTAVLAPKIQQVLSPPEEQLDETTRAQLLELVQYLQQQA
ncbi:ARM repeat-containing protein [Trichodelitschia bisporula]|uniref:ARM repeat-containing protein n=1 Tax=Trichodelitschia bisporula TaxID=703511 RepID=A0A6G1HM24_9PEZI|nr:ARM repeat-containing protein [Trichodelitschia bisporula]